MLDRMAYMVRHERNFSAELSHELRTPLSAISAEAEIALRKSRNPDQYRKSLERISEQAKDLTRILETLLDVARSESSAVPEETVDLFDSIEAAATGTRSLADQYGIAIELERPLTDPKAQLAGDKFQRMIAPILENAVTYARSSVSISVLTSSRMAQVIVSDDGPGFTREDIESAFEPGVRGSARRNQAAPAGTGLGLALARRLARANGGEVSIGEAAGRTEVTLSVPLALGSAT